MSWEDQGRREHGWFGTGISATDRQIGAPDADGMFGREGLRQRIQAAIYGTVAELPAPLRTHDAAQPSAKAAERLTDLMVAWGGATKLPSDRFAALFFGRPADDPVATALRNAAMAANMAKTHDELQEAASNLAAAQQIVGLDRWFGFLADARQRADDPATVAAAEESNRTPDPAKDAIRPVYPVETLLGVGTAGLAGGVAAAARAAGGAILRQILPSPAKPNIQAMPNAVEARIPPDKIADYALNPQHLGGGADKARVFESALGYNRGNASGLISQLRSGVRTNPAIPGRIDEFGQRYTVDVPVTGPKGNAVVRTGWIVDRGSNIPRLVTLFVK